MRLPNPFVSIEHTLHSRLHWCSVPRQCAIGERITEVRQGNDVHAATHLLLQRLCVVTIQPLEPRLDGVRDLADLVDVPLHMAPCECLSSQHGLNYVCS